MIKTIIKYEVDGVQFDTEEEAIDYERLNKYRDFDVSNFILYDCYGLQIPFANFNIDPEKVYEKLAFFIIKEETEELSHYLEDIQFIFGFELPSKKGMYRYDIDSDEWVSYEEEKKILDDKWSVLKSWGHIK